MATVYRTKLNNYSGGGPSLDRDTGELVVVGEQQFVSQFMGQVMVRMTSSWHYSQLAADMAVLPDLRAARDKVVALIESIENTADTGRSGCDSSAIV